MEVYRVYVVEDWGYDGIWEDDVGVFLNGDDAKKCVDLCQQMVEDGRLRHDYVYCDAYEIDDLETATKRLKEMCKSEEKS